MDIGRQALGNSEVIPISLTGSIFIIELRSIRKDAIRGYL